MSWFSAPRSTSADMNTQSNNRKSFTETISVTNMDFRMAYPPYFKEENKQDILPTCYLLCTHPSTYPSIQTQCLLKAYYAPGPRLASRAPSQTIALKPVKRKLKYRFFLKYILPTLILEGKNPSKLMEYGKLYKSINKYVIEVF